MKKKKKGPGWSVKQRCTGMGNGWGGCQSLLLIEEDDIYVTSHTDCTGDTEIYYTFSCPVCGRETDINSTTLPMGIPYSIRQTALKKYRNDCKRKIR